MKILFARHATMVVDIDGKKMMSLADMRKNQNKKRF